MYKQYVEGVQKRKMAYLWLMGIKMFIAMLTFWFNGKPRFFCSKNKESENDFLWLSSNISRGAQRSRTLSKGDNYLLYSNYSPDIINLFALIHSTAILACIIWPVSLTLCIYLYPLTSIWCDWYQIMKVGR